MLAVSLIAQGLFLLASLIVSAKLTIRTKSAIRGGLCLYGLLVLGTVLFCVVLPAVLAALGVDNHTIVRAFPEAIGIPGVVLVYWVPAFAFAGLVRAASEKIHTSERSSPQQELDGR